MPGEESLRASDADRDRAASLLREHHAAGRLSAEEFHERLDAALEAKTLGELEALLRDLPSIDLYRLPDAALRRRPAGGGLPAGGLPVRMEPGAGAIVPRAAIAWGVWAALNGAFMAIWLVGAVISGGAAWAPWFLLIAVPSAIALARRNQSR